MAATASAIPGCALNLVGGGEGRGGEGRGGGGGGDRVSSNKDIFFRAVSTVSHNYCRSHRCSNYIRIASIIGPQDEQCTVKSLKGY